MHQPTFLAVTSGLSLIMVLGAIQYGTAQTELQTYRVNIRIGSSVPVMQADQQPLYDPPILPNNTAEEGIATGSTVIWINDDESYHTVTSGDALTGPDRIFDSGILSPKVSWSYTFNNPGEYNYFCTVHPFMRGLVKVTG